VKVQDLAVLVKGIAPVVRDYVATALTGVSDRLAALEGVTAEHAALCARVAILETRPSVPGPPGDAGPPGKDGADGRPGLKYWGVYQDGKAYDAGDLVTWAGSAWHCEEATTSKPGEYAGAKAWTLMVKRGRDGKDGKP
jgi:hypothetical protein